MTWCAHSSWLRFKKKNGQASQWRRIVHIWVCPQLMAKVQEEEEEEEGQASQWRRIVHIWVCPQLMAKVQEEEEEEEGQASQWRIAFVRETSVAHRRKQHENISITSSYGFIF